MQNLEPNESNNKFLPKMSEQEASWCQELATTLDPFNPESLTPRQIQILTHFQWLDMVGPQGFELTQLILQKLHRQADQNQILHN